MRKLLSILLLLILSINAFSQVPAYVPNSGLVAYWPFNGNANDESGNGNNGTVNGATLTADRNGNANSAYYFSSEGCATRIDATVNTSSIQSGLTISIWLNRTGNGCLNPRIFEFYSGSGGPTDAFLHWFNNNETYFGSRTSNNTSVAASFTPEPDNTWFNLIYTNDGNVGRFYKNGILFQTVLSSGSIFINGNVAFGRMNHPSYDAFNGSLDDIGIWNRALTQQEITNLYTGNVPMSCIPSYVPTNGLVGYWPFCGNANDESGNGNNGTVNGATLTTDRFGNSNKAYSFDGVNDFINIPDNTTLDLVNDFTISAWLNPNNFGIVNMILSKHDANLGGNAGTYAMGLWQVSNNSLINFQAAPNYNPNTYPGITGSVQTNAWRNFVVTYVKSSGLLTYYLDNTPVFSTVITFTIQNTNQPLRIGANFNINTLVDLFSGSLDDIGIWNRALTQQEITNIYTGTVPTPTCAVTATDSTICVGQTVTLTSNANNFSSTTPCTSTELPSNLQTGLVGYWPFCGNANDASGNGNNGTVNGATLTADRFGNANSAYSFDGVNDYMMTNGGAQFNTQNLSIAFWCSFNDVNSFTGTLVTLGSSQSCIWGPYYNNSQPGIGYATGIGCGGNFNGVSSNLTSNNWGYISVVANGTNISLYLNGSYIGQTTNNFGSGCTNNNLYFGVDIFGIAEYFGGKLDDIGIWNRTLSNSEIQQLYNQGQTTYAWSPGGATTPSISVSPTQTTTYTCTVTSNGSSCSDDVTIIVDTPPTPTITASESTSICSGNSITLTSSSATGNVWSTGETTQSITVSTAGNFHVTVTNTSGCSATSANTSVTVNALPTVNAGVDQTVCAGTSVTLSGTGANTYTWNNSVNNGIAFTPASTATYTITGTNTATGCTNTDQVIVNVNALPTVNAGIDQTVCAETAVTLSGTGANTYSWNNGVSNGIAFTPTSTGTYTVTGTNTASGCTNTDQVVVTINPLPTVNAGSDQMICSGTAITLNGSGASTYAWDNNVSNGVAFTPLASGAYTVTGTNLNGCTNADQVFVMVHTLPAVNAGVDQSICTGIAVTLSASGANTYAWNNNVSNGVAFTPTVSGSYTVTGTDVFGCTNTDQVTVTVNLLPTVNAGLDQTLCQGQSTTLFGSGANTYSWTNNVSDGVGFLPTITQEYAVTGTNTTTGCSNTDQVIITVNPLPNVNAGTDQSICKGDAVTLLGTGANAYTWNNNITNGLAFNPIATATYSVSGTDANGCINSDEVTVTVNEASASTLTESAMDSYTLNGQTYTQSGTYTQVIPNASGCDSTITLNLTLSFTGITEIENTNVLVYPNPTNDLLNIILPTESSLNYVLLDSRGRKVQEGSINGAENLISLKACTPGAYFLKIGQDEVPIRVIKQ